MIFFDTETTGLIKNVALPLDRQPRIIEIGCIREPKNPGKYNNFSSIFNPGVKLEPIITKITGLTDEDCEASPKFHEELESLCEFFLGEDTPLEAQQAFADYQKQSADPEDAEAMLDSGVGIAPENIEPVLSDFGQVDSSLTRKYDGSGLGLPLSKKLAELHGGELVIESQLGAGTPVTILFPKERTIRLSS